MLLQKRKNIKCYSRLLKTVDIPFDKLTDSFMLRKTIYHETSFVKFRDEVTYNMPVWVQTKIIKSRLWLLYATSRENRTAIKNKSIKKQNKCISCLSLICEKGFYILHNQRRFYLLFFVLYCSLYSFYILYILLLL